MTSEQKLALAKGIFELLKKEGLITGSVDPDANVAYGHLSDALAILTNVSARLIAAYTANLGTNPENSAEKIDDHTTAIVNLTANNLDHMVTGHLKEIVLSLTDAVEDVVDQQGKKPTSH